MPKDKTTLVFYGKVNDWWQQGTFRGQQRLFKTISKRVEIVKYGKVYTI